MGGRNDLFVGGGQGVLSGEAYRRRLMQIIGSPMHAGDAVMRERVLGLPLGAGSGFVSNSVRHNGYVFCARIRGHEKPWFRYVPVASDTWECLPESSPSGIRISSDTASALRIADPGKPDLQVELSEHAKTQVFAAWEHARADIYTTWTALTDIANITPDIPRAFLRARELLLQHGDQLSRERRVELAVLLTSNWDYRVTSDIRNIMNLDTPVGEKVAFIDRYFRDQGLVAPPPPEALPPITIDDIEVVCWMAVQAATPTA